MQLLARTNGKLYILVFCVIILCLWCGFLLYEGKKDENRKWYLKAAPCKHSDQKLAEMADLVFLIHNILDEFKVGHCVCFGTLWGALRNGDVLPWDNNVDICVTVSEINKISSSDLISALKANGAETAYNSRYGQYEIKYKTVTGYISVWIGKFGFGESTMSQLGWGRWSLFSRQKEYVIPSRLLEPPYPTVKFYEKSIPVPHEDIEILKYFYPDDWWLEVKPLGCQ